MNDVPRKAKHRQLALKFWLAATAKEPVAANIRRRDLAIGQLNPRSAFGAADVRAGGPPVPQWWVEHPRRHQEPSASIKTRPPRDGSEARWQRWREMPSQ